MNFKTILLSSCFLVPLFSQNSSAVEVGIICVQPDGPFQIVTDSILTKRREHFGKKVTAIKMTILTNSENAPLPVDLAFDPETIAFDNMSSADVEIYAARNKSHKVNIMLKANLQAVNENDPVALSELQIHYLDKRASARLKRTIYGLIVEKMFCKIIDNDSALLNQSDRKP